MSTFNDLVSEITGIVPGYSAFLAQKDLQKAWRDVLNRRTWSFLIADSGFNAPAQVGGGFVTLTQNLTTITADATADAILAPLVTAVPPLSLRQFRISTAGGIYNIVSYVSSTKILTVDRPILEQSGPTSSWLVYQCYFPPPPDALSTGGYYDFNRWLSVVDPINGYKLRVETNKAWLDWKDPQRSCFDLAYRIYDYKTDSLGNPFYEFWPHPSQGQQFIALYKRKGLAFVTGSQPLPAMIPEALLIDRCLTRYTYRWASVNAGRDPNLAKTNWPLLMREGTVQWERDLQVAKLEDDNVFMQVLLPRWRGIFGFPIDARFLQSHSTGLEALGI